MKLSLSKINALKTRDDILHPARARYKAETDHWTCKVSRQAIKDNDIRLYSMDKS